jgi:hypothetical protein
LAPNFFELSRTTIGHDEIGPKTLSRFRFLRIRLRSSFADRLLPGAVGHTLRHGFSTALSVTPSFTAFLTAFSTFFVAFFLALSFAIVGTLERDLVSQLGIVHGAPFRCFPRSASLCA